jgi:hypothetical protein
MSFLLYFITMWVGSKRNLGKIKARLSNYLWLGSENMAKAWISRDDCTMSYKAGAL